MGLNYKLNIIDLKKWKSTELLHNLVDILNENCTLRISHRDRWQTVLNCLEYIPVRYMNSTIEYYLIVEAGRGNIWHDISVILTHEGQDIGIFPLSISVDNEISRISSHGRPVLPPIMIPSLPRKIHKEGINFCLDLVKKITEIFQIKSWQSYIGFPQCINLDSWYRHILEQGGTEIIVEHELYLNLDLPLDKIRQSFRKRYKNLINVGERCWQVGILSSPDVSIWEEFENLHLYVAGRKTRSEASWQEQYRQVVTGDAFLVYARDDNHRMIGGGLFNCSRDECAYSVGAYDRNLFDKPISHIIQFYAIKEMKKRQIHWYYIGKRFYQHTLETPTDKELSISHFKEGFASHMIPALLIKASMI
jgi:FemAB family protein